jgi:hypothetical protein
MRPVAALEKRSHGPQCLQTQVCAVKASKVSPLLAVFVVFVGHFTQDTRWLKANLILITGTENYFHVFRLSKLLLK